MDPSVVAAMAKWPNVPDCRGWLSLDRRGQWRLQGKPVAHAGLADFIGRNYERHDSGAWFMQNGPQRVWVALDATPWVFHLGNGETLLTHTGLAVEDVQAAWLVDGESLCLTTEFGPGMVDDRDLPAMLERIQVAAGGPVEEDLGSDNLFVLVWSGKKLPLQRCTTEQLREIGSFRPMP
jgi:hypothetical protein